MANVFGELVNAIKALFTQNTTNAASVSGARVPFVQADGTPIGNDSMANLASVLGVGTTLALSSSDDMNNIVVNCGFSVSSGSSMPTNAPYSGAFMGVCFATGTLSCVQFAVIRSGDISNIKIRKLYSGTWTDWKYVTLS